MVSTEKVSNDIIASPTMLNNNRILLQVYAPPYQPSRVKRRRIKECKRMMIRDYVKLSSRKIYPTFND